MTEPQIVTTDRLSEIVKTEIDVQISTAKRYPRSLEKFRQDAMSMATADKEIAASCFYKLKRKTQDGGFGFIEGPSVRLAEIVANAWGNLRFGARITIEGDKEVVAQGVAHDLEKNVSNTIEVSRRITTKDGKRYGDDMIGVTKNAACSIALRNAIFKTVPFTYVKQIYEAAKKTAVGDAKTLAERRQMMLESFGKMNVSKEQVLTFLEKKSFEDVGIAEVETMIGVYNAIKDGDTTIDEQFNPKKAEMPRRAGEAPPAAATGSAPAPEGKAAADEEKPVVDANFPAGFEKIQAKVKTPCGNKDCAAVIEKGETVAFSKERGIFHPDCAPAVKA